MLYNEIEDFLKAFTSKVHLKYIIFGVPMLKRNNLICLTFLLLSFVVFNSCCNEPKGASFSIGCTLYNRDNITSDKVKINEIEMHWLDSETGETIENIQTLENVPCSLRNDSISDGEILAYRKSRDDGTVSFSFLQKEKEVKNSACYYLADFEQQAIRSSNGTLDFYIVINDPELSGYDDKYETVRLACPYGAKREIVYLGKNLN